MFYCRVAKESGLVKIAHFHFDSGGGLERGGRVALQGCSYFLIGALEQLHGQGKTVNSSILLLPDDYPAKPNPAPWVSDVAQRVRLS